MTDDRRCIRARCRQGGTAPCIDDLCHGVDTTMCGLEDGFDFCGISHTEECPARREEEDDWLDGPD